MERMHEDVESAMRELLEQGDIAPPDAVEYEPSSVVFLWHERNLAVVVDLGD